MPRYFVEVPHDGTKEACDKAIQAFRETGSHFLTNADWGCEEGEHKAWFILEIDNKEDVLHMLPPFYRRTAKIIEVKKFTPETMYETMGQHEK